MKINLTKYKREISDEIRHLQKKLKKYHFGNLLFSRNGKYIKWYVSNHSSSHYIRKSQRALAVALAEKAYYKHHLTSLLLQQKYLTQYEKDNQKISDALEAMLQNNSPYVELLQDNILTLPQEAVAWMQEEYPKNMTYPENLVHATYAGDMVRSKSEAMIANLLFQNKIPYRYENMLVLGESAFSPDFTILHPKTGKVYYWEHFGLMDNPAYVDKNFNKLKVYAIHDIIPSINLILTFETKLHPLDAESVEKIIEEYF